ncbi:MAG: Zn-dependent protease with chaperone function [Planctomycetota bacterium]|jgi:Zn-dependent protease with chaperone function/uncharacterized tellurite resistance protein B-like protein
MDFFGHQDQARKASGRLVWLFVAAVICIIVLIYIAAKLTLIASDVGPGHLIDWPVLGAVAGLVIVVVGGAMLYKTAQLRTGGSVVAEMLGGRLVEIDTKDPQEKVLRNVVEEMAIASGVPVPDVFVIDGEAGINAFAAGWSPADAAIAVTRGSLEAFTRDELQGVIAHEFSHVFHGDMRLNIRLMGVLFGIVCISVIGRILCQGAFYGGMARSHRSDDRRSNGQGIIIFGFALVIIGYVGVFFARLIQSAVSRQREYLADASAVQYTRNPRGIGLALAKIGGLTAQMKNPHTEEASHMLFADGVSRFGSAMATHPPLEERIERVLPGFLKHIEPEGSLTDAVNQTPATQQFAGGAVSGLAGGTTPRRLLATVGDPQPKHVDAAHQLLAALPLDLTVAAHEPGRAPSLVYALLLDEDRGERNKQLQLLKDCAGDSAAIVHDTQACYREVAALARNLRLPLFELTTPALRSLPDSERRTLQKRARELAMADDHLSPFEFALIKSLERHVRTTDQATPRAQGRRLSLQQCANEAAFVLSVIAHADAKGDTDKAATAFARGAEVLSLPNVQLVDAKHAKPQQLDRAIERLGRMSPFAKRNLLTGCAEVAASDGHLSAEEVDLVRALGELWDCPVPLTVDD